MLDHIVLATPNVASTAEWLADLTGVVANEGGPHVGRGTRNRLCSFGDTYLEIIGPDPDQPDPEEPRSFGIDGLLEARVVTWCARQHDLRAVVAAGESVGLSYTEPVAMRREAPEFTLDWHLSLPLSNTEGGIIPFFIDWGSSPHPSVTATPGLRVALFRGVHPEPDRVQRLLDALGERVDVAFGTTARLEVTLEGPTGSVSLP